MRIFQVAQQECVVFLIGYTHAFYTSCRKAFSCFWWVVFLLLCLNELCRRISSL